MYYNQRISDASISMEQFRKNPKLGVAYDINDPAF
jgi:hypothetical protein